MGTRIERHASTSTCTVAMAHLAREAFSRVVAGMGLAINTPVAVALSGGGDSTALTYLAREVFDRVVGVTIDHGLREGSGEEAEKVGEIVRKIGAEHHTIALEWEERPSSGKLQSLARVKRYAALFSACQEMGLTVLMTGHHMEDQAETFLYRMSKGSGVTGLACLQPLTHWPEYPSVRLVRPLLRFSKSSLLSVCRENGLEWVEDPTNSTPIYLRNVIRQILRERDDVVPGILGMVETCAGAKAILDTDVAEAFKRLPIQLNTACGYLTLKAQTVQSLPPPTARTVLRTLIRFIGGGTKFVHYELVDSTYNFILQPKKMKAGSPSTLQARSCGRCNIIALQDDNIAIARALPTRTERTLTPIEVGETILWDSRFEVTVVPLEVALKSHMRRSVKQPKGLTHASNGKHQFFVRHMNPNDWVHAKKGIRRNKSSSLPHEHVRGGLPVLVDGNGKMVAIPHFKMVDRSFGVSCEIKFKPAQTLDEVIALSK